ncbi:hypothetical protein AB0A77_02055 [Streptomyces varsoviensis]|uniref:hypothetical protein n=1 Tax=Streptomyces varsoviensis TaxID=67373 RepID=UPI0033CCBC66
MSRPLAGRRLGDAGGLGKRKDVEREALARKVGVAVGVVGFFFIRVWLLMLAVGALHGAVPGVPTISYGTAGLVLLGVQALKRPTSAVDSRK